MTTNRDDETITLTVIVPTKIGDARAYLVDSVMNTFMDDRLPDGVDVLVVDDGSEPDHLERLRQAIAGTEHISLVQTGARPDDVFSLPRIRNFGAQQARSDYLLFMDADLAPYPGFFRDLLDEIEDMAERGGANDFLMVPCLYLTEAGRALFETIAPDRRRTRFINAMLEGDRSLVRQHSTGTSAVVVRRDYYLVRGGNDPSFTGWGYEDYEFGNRLARRAGKFAEPADWLRGEGNFMKLKSYVGWKAAYLLNGDWLARKGIWLFHLPHEIEEELHATKGRNWEILEQRMKADLDGGAEPPVLADPYRGRSLLLQQNPFTFAREIAPYLGEVVSLDATDVVAEGIEAALEARKIDRIVFGNPYRDEATIALYQWCRETGFPFLICERGALPDSVSHDTTGFLADSTLYDPEHWDRPLSDKQRAAIKAYLGDLRLGTNALETQGDRTTGWAARQALGIGPGKKVLFVPFQQPRDTSIRFFAGAIGTYEAFRDLVGAVARALGPDWVVVTKKHPAEDDLEPVAGTIAANSANIYDLIDLSDAMLLINSGTGLLGLAFEKPVFLAGNAFYAEAGLTVSLSETEIAEPATVAERIRDGFTPDREKMLRFLHYLRFDYYSFGRQHTRLSRYADGSPITATTAIDYYEVRGVTDAPVIYRTNEEPIGFESPIYDRYDRKSLVRARDLADGTISLSGRRRAKTRAGRKFQKLLRDPGGFFRDSRNPLLRPIGKLLG